MLISNGIFFFAMQEANFRAGDRVSYYQGRQGEVVSVLGEVAKVRDDLVGLVWRLPLLDLALVVGHAGGEASEAD